MTMLFAGANFMVGAGLNAGAEHIAMLVVGRLLLGFGVGSANQVVPLYLSEMAPFKYRCALGCAGARALLLAGLGGPQL